MMRSPLWRREINRHAPLASSGTHFNYVSATHCVQCEVSSPSIRTRVNTHNLADAQHCQSKARSSRRCWGRPDPQLRDLLGYRIRRLNMAGGPAHEWAGTQSACVRHNTRRKYAPV